MEEREPFSRHVRLASLTGYEIGRSHQMGGLSLHLETHVGPGFSGQTLDAFLTPAQAIELALALQGAVRDHEASQPP